MRLSTWDRLCDQWLHPEMYTLSSHAEKKQCKRRYRVSRRTVRIAKKHIKALAIGLKPKYRQIDAIFEGQKL